jgi:hypothetical protein
MMPSNIHGWETKTKTKTKGILSQRKNTSGKIEIKSIPGCYGLETNRPIKER